MGLFSLFIRSHCCTFPLRINMLFILYIHQGQGYISSQAPMGTWSNSLPLDVLAMSHLQCFPHCTTALCCICIILPLHCLCKTCPLFATPSSSFFPLVIPTSLSLSLSSVRLVPISSSLAVSCCAERAGHGSVAAVVFEVKVVLGIGKEYAMSPVRLRCGKKKRRGNTSVGGNPQQEDPGSVLSH